MKKAFYLVSFITLFSCSDEKKTAQSTASDTAQTTAHPIDSQPAAAVASQSKSQPGAVTNSGRWIYESKANQEGNTVYKASTLSPDSLRFGFPYAAGSTATLTIRKRETSTTLYLQVSNGQFNRSFQGGQARIRFDNQSAGNYAFSAAENGSANIIFFDEAQRLIARMKAARKMIIDVEFYAQGHRQIEFRTAGLQWSH